VVPEGSVYLGSGTDSGIAQGLKLKYANRHGLVAGATGTGKTVTVQIMAEAFSAAGVPVFVADVKGDVSGLSQAGSPHPKLEERADILGLSDFDYAGSPSALWDLFGKMGHPVRATVTDMGPLLLSRMLDLNATQEGVLNIAFAVADEEGMPLLDFKDLRQMLVFVGQHRKQLSLSYGAISTASIGAIQRSLLTLARQGAEAFIGEPALKLADLMRTDDAGRGVINILSAETLMTSPKLYAAFMLWLVSELFEELPEAGDTDKPKLVFFFDEAHLLFRDAEPGLIEKVEQVVRLIRSKGVGLYFITQNPQDVPDRVLSQLGNRIQHALRAYTPSEQRAVRVAADSFRPNPAFDTQSVITQLGVGEALVSTLEKKGVPSVVEKTLIRPPQCRMGPITPTERQAILAESPLGGLYDETLDRHSASEILQQRMAEAEDFANEDARDVEDQRRFEADRGRRSGGGGVRYGISGGNRRVSSSGGSSSSRPQRRSSRSDSISDAAMKSFARSMSSTMGRELSKSIARGLFGSTRRRRSSSKRRRR